MAIALSTVLLPCCTDAEMPHPAWGVPAIAADFIALTGLVVGIICALSGVHLPPAMMYSMIGVGSVVAASWIVMLVWSEGDFFLIMKDYCLDDVCKREG